LQRLAHAVTFARLTIQQRGPRQVMTTSLPKTYYFEDLHVGLEASLERVVSHNDVVSFADVSGDRNPVHLDPAYAAKTQFGGCITHGMLTASYISAVFGMQLPGPGAIYISQTLNFKAPVRVGDRVHTTVTVVELFAAKRRARFECQCLVDGKAVLAGEAILLVPTYVQ
jgi:3-hydroxybutyryl-CoA dehydratase